MAARGRREAVLAAKKSAKRPVTGAPEESQGEKKPTPKKLKYHSLGDYPDQIASYGTTDNPSTQVVRMLS